MFCAEKDGWDFMADTPCGLLGVVGIFEWKKPTSYKEYWWRERGDDIYGILPKTPPDYTPVYMKKDI